MKKKPLKVSIIIPVRKINDFIHESIPKILALDWPSFEILIFTDEQNLKNKWPKTKIIVSGKVGPAEKRDLATKYANGEILAFIDDDAFPHKNWLKHALVHFDNSEIVAVGGPGVTPPNASFMEKASGWVSSSPVGAGPYSYRFLPGKKRFVDDYPSMNLLVRKKYFDKVGGFDSNYYPGEDTKLCLDLTNLGKKIIYEPKAKVYHHRRPLWISHLKQNGSFGLHRGFFARILPQTSARPIYFMPSFLVLTLLTFLISSFFNSAIYYLSSSILLCYALLLMANSLWIGLSSKNIALALICIPAIIATHFWYGIRFIQGFVFTKQLKQ